MRRHNKKIPSTHIGSMNLPAKSFSVSLLIEIQLSPKMAWIAILSDSLNSTVSVMVSNRRINHK